eukprot:11730071-Alexandrium_andersonii.AAC.1
MDPPPKAPPARAGGPFGGDPGCSSPPGEEGEEGSSGTPFLLGLCSWNAAGRPVGMGSGGGA